MLYIFLALYKFHATTGLKIALSLVLCINTPPAAPVNQSCCKLIFLTAGICQTDTPEVPELTVCDFVSPPAFHLSSCFPFISPLCLKESESMQYSEELLSFHHFIVRLSPPEELTMFIFS